MKKIIFLVLLIMVTSFGFSGCSASYKAKKSVVNSHKKRKSHKHSKGRLVPQNKVRMYECRD